MPEVDRSETRGGATASDRVRLGALRYATNPESDQYLAIMRVFTAGTSGLMSDLSAAEVTDRLAADPGGPPGGRPGPPPGPPAGLLIPALRRNARINFPPRGSTS